MTYTIDFKVEGDVLFVKTSGKLHGVETFSEKAKTVVGEILRTNAKRIMLDDRELAVTLDALDIKDIADQLEKSNLQTMGLRLACMCRKLDSETYKLVETMYQNRSLNFRLFQSRDEALDWLIG